MAADLRGASAESLLALVDDLDGVLSGSFVSRLVDRIAGTGRAGADPARVADDLFAVAGVLASEPGLRRTLTDASLDSHAKGRLVHQVFDGKLDEGSVDIVASAAGRRWTGARDLGYALEHLGVVAVVRAAEATGEPDRMEDDLFAFGRLVSTNPELRDALADPSRTSEDKRVLLRGLLQDRISPAALALAEQSVSGFHRTPAVAVAAYQRIAADQRQRLSALVRVARPLDQEQADRLSRTLSAQYSRPVRLNVVVDPAVIGGIRVEIGDDVIDGTVVSRLDDARRKLAG